MEKPRHSRILPRALRASVLRAVPSARSKRDPIPELATPGELLAVTHATFMTRALSEVLADAGSTANELVVEAECTFAGPVAERELPRVSKSVQRDESASDDPSWPGPRLAPAVFATYQL